MLVARRILVTCVSKGRGEPTLCNLPMDSLDAARCAMAHVNEEVSNLAEEIVLNHHQ